MSKVIIYHNPRCSKSRQTLALLEQQGAQVEVINYLQTPPSEDELQRILNLLKLSAGQLLRTSEAAYKQYHLDDPQLSDAFLIKTMIQHPQLIQRPIVIHAGKAALGRPPENVLAIL